MITKQDMGKIEHLVGVLVEKGVANHEYRFDHFIHPEFVKAHLLTSAVTNSLLRGEGEVVVLSTQQAQLVKELQLLSAAIRDRLQLLGVE